MSDFSVQTEEIVVFVKPKCIQCNGTFKALDRAGLEYEIVDVSKDTAAGEYILSLGYLQAPVTIVSRIGQPDERWCGFRPDRIKSIRNADAPYAA